MTFVDELNLHIESGHGGDGVVRWRRAKNRPKGGPAGGNGGNGGDAYIVGTRDLDILSVYASKPSFKAEDGRAGGSRSLEGKNGEDLRLKIPVGSVIKRTDTGEEFELLEEGEEILLLRGGRGGLGNEHFKSSTNVNPMESTPGKPAEKADYYVEVRLIADAGFIGLPSAGKSSLLNALTNAKSKVGEYHFTTLEPSLGNFFGFILADIPGLIEGASEGKGLGHKFLKHIARTKVLFHLVSLESQNPTDDYKAIRSELEKFDKSLIEKQEVTILSKTDLVTESELKKVRSEFQKLGNEVLDVTILDDDSVKNLSDAITKILS